MRVPWVLAVAALVLVARAAWPQGDPVGSEFRVNTFTAGIERLPSVAADTAGNFIVIWHGQDGGGYGILGQRFASSGAPLGSEFRVNAYTTGNQRNPSVAADSSGNFVVVWQSHLQDGSDEGVFGQRYASSGAPIGPEFRANTYTPSNQFLARVAADPSGNFVVVWTSSEQDGSGFGIFGQRYASSGTPLGPEFRVNTNTTEFQALPSVAADASGNFVVVWASSLDGSSLGLFGQRYISAGAPLGPEFRVNTYTTGDQYAGIRSVAADPLGNFVVVWVSDFQDGSNRGIFGQRYNMIVPVELMHFRVE